MICMIRKVAKIGPSTLMVSLPNNWVRENSVKKGDELDVEARKSELIIRVGIRKNDSEESVTLDTRGVHESLGRIAGAYYKAGYDKIKFIYDSPEALAIIQRQIGRSYIGFDIVEESRNTIVLKKLSNLEAKEFDGVIKRCIFSLINMADESLEALKNGDQSQLNKVVLLDDSINKASDFCRRLLNRGEYSGIKRAAPVYYIAEELEKVGDMYRDIAKYCVENPVKLSPEAQKIYKSVNDFLKMFSKLYFNFNLKDYEEFIGADKKLKGMIKDYILRIPKKEIQIFMHLSNIQGSLFDMNGPLITSRL